MAFATSATRLIRHCLTYENVLTRLPRMSRIRIVLLDVRGGTRSVSRDRSRGRSEECETGARHIRARAAGRAHLAVTLITLAKITFCTERYPCYLGPTHTHPFNGHFSGTTRLVAWHSGRTSVSGRRTFPVLRSTCS